MFEGIFGALVSIAANLIYIDKKYKGFKPLYINEL